MMRELVELRRAQFLVGLQYREPRLEAALAAQKIPYVSFDGAEHYPGDGDHWTPKGHEAGGGPAHDIVVRKRNRIARRAEPIARLLSLARALSAIRQRAIAPRA